MIFSMTGYAALSLELPQGTINLEIKSVNHRYLETQFRIMAWLPAPLRFEQVVTPTEGSTNKPALLLLR